MKKIYFFQPADKEAPFLAFMGALDSKAQKKIEYALKCMALSPGRLSEPQVKHFSIERYRQLYELREKVRVLVRIVFTLDKAGNVILLQPFIKQHKRNTYQALEASLVMLDQISKNPGTLHEYSFNHNSDLHGGTV